MSDEKREAHNLYVQYLAVCSDNIGTSDSDMLQRIDELRGRVSVIILQFLCQCRPQERFRHTEFPNVIMLSSRLDDFEAEKAVEAFYNLEQYLLLLCLMPWKQEYHKLKRYGGFYQTKLESHLRGAESIFRLIGFTERVSGLLILTHSTKPDVMQYIAFECLCAALECRIISDIWKRTCRGRLKIYDVVNIRLQTAGSADIVVSFIESKYGVAMTMAGSNEIDCRGQRDEKSVGERSPTDTFRNKLQEHLKMAEKHGAGKNSEPDIPFIDDETKELDHTPSCFDDHLMASLQIVGNKEVSPLPSADSSAGMRPSQEWSFVREGLEKNYGKKYFEGIRKDILSNEKESDNLTHQKLFESSGDYPIRGSPKDVPHTHAPFASRMIPSSAPLDSAYMSGASTYPGNSQYAPSFPQKSDTDVIKRGAATYTISKTAKTEPLLRQPVDSGLKSGFHTGFIKASDSTKTYQKRSSLPVNPADTNVRQGSVTSQNSSIIANKVGKNIRDNHQTGENYSGNVGVNVHDSNNGIFINGTTHSSSKASSNISRLPAKSWNCTYCTYVNPNDLIICSMCSKSREVTDMDSPTAGTKLRVCGKCTLENSKDSVECSACGHSLKNTQTVV